MGLRLGFSWGKRMKMVAEAWVEKFWGLGF